MVSASWNNKSKPRSHTYHCYRWTAGIKRGTLKKGEQGFSRLPRGPIQAHEGGSELQTRNPEVSDKSYSISKIGQIFNMERLQSYKCAKKWMCPIFLFNKISSQEIRDCTRRRTSPSSRANPRWRIQGRMQMGLQRGRVWIVLLNCKLWRIWL